MNKAFDPFGLSRLDPVESDDEGWQEREASRTHSVKFTEETEQPAETNKEVNIICVSICMTSFESAFHYLLWPDSANVD